MGPPSVTNRTPFAFEPLALADEDLRPLLVLVAKATYSIRNGSMKLAEEQVPVHVAGVPWGKPEESSYRYEPECAFVKVATDVVLVGHAWAPRHNTRELLVSLQVGPVKKAIRVVGDRIWQRRLGFISMTHPLPFERMPLVYERAFGGWDRSKPDPAQHTFDPRNPVGVGFRSDTRSFEEGLRLPNLEEPSHPLEHFGQKVPPACFGFLSPHWQPRASLVGTYDETWDKKRKPLLPRDFHRRFFNAAPPDLIASGYLRGDEPVIITHASPREQLAFSLPGQAAPTVTVELVGAADVSPSMQLDTVIIDTDEEHVQLLWRGHVPLLNGIHDVRTLHVTAKGFS